MAVLIIPERIKEEMQKTAVAIKRSRQGRPFRGGPVQFKCQKKKAEKQDYGGSRALNTCGADKRGKRAGRYGVATKANIIPAER